MTFILLWLALQDTRKPCWLNAFLGYCTTYLGEVLETMNTIQSDFEPLVLPPVSNPTFPDIWAPSDGFIFNGGFKLDIF